MVPASWPVQEIIMKNLLSILAGICVLGMCAFPSWGEEFGMLTDKTGEVELVSKGKKNLADMGAVLFAGDELLLQKGSLAMIVSFADCQEWSVKGPGKLIISGGKIEGQDNLIAAAKKLPLCYSPTSMKGAESHEMGGFLLRGEDPTAKLREEFQSGKAGNSTLMTLIMHDLKNGNAGKARPCFDELKKRIPESPFIKSIARHFQ